MQNENPHAGQGSVALDIGGDVGALVVIMPAEMEGVEVEIRPVGAVAPKPETSHAHDHEHGSGHSHAHDDAGHSHEYAHSPWPHVAVVIRPTPSGPLPSLVYGALYEGSYELYVRPDGPVQLTADVTGGAVTEAEWPR